MKKLVNIFVTTVFIGLAAVLPAQAISLDEMKTPAEASNYTRTSALQVRKLLIFVRKLPSKVAAGYVSTISAILRWAKR